MDTIPCWGKIDFGVNETESMALVTASFCDVLVREMADSRITSC